MKRYQVHLQKILETVAADYFDLEHLPELSLDRNNFEQIQIVF